METILIDKGGSGYNLGSDAMYSAEECQKALDECQWSIPKVKEKYGRR